MGKTLETIKALEEFADEQIEQKKKAQRQLDEVKSDLEFRRDLFELQEQQLNKVRSELIETITQRNNLAEALENCREDSIELLGERDWWQLENRCDYQKRYQDTRDNVTRADEVLESLIKLNNL